MIYWKKKKKSSQSVDSANSKGRQSIEDKDGSLVSCYEMVNVKSLPSTSDVDVTMKTAALHDDGNFDDGHVYELTDVAMTSYNERSWVCNATPFLHWRETPTFVDNGFN